MRFGVVTHVPEGDDAWGNLAIVVPTHIQMRANDPKSCTPTEKTRILPLGTLLALRGPVFTLGEILVLDPDTGREISGHQRKPSKWSVAVEEFDTVEEAISRARSLESE